MKVTHNQLKQYVDFDWSPEELAERLTMLGMEVDSMVLLDGETQTKTKINFHNETSNITKREL